MYSSGDVVLASVQFADTFEIKTRPAVVLFEEMGNIVIAGVTSNTKMNGVQLLQKDGMIKDSVIKTNYIFTISHSAIKKKMFSLSKQKRKELYSSILGKLSPLNE